MSPPRPALLLLLLGALLQTVVAQVPCQCEEAYLQHYLAKDCTAHFDDAVSECCPASFICLTEAERGLSPSKCYFEGTAYEVGASMPDTGVCSVGCFCSPGSGGGPATIECANVECPSLFTRPKPGCREVKTPGQCCGPIVCDINNPAASIRATKCFSEGKSYNEGDYMDFDNDQCQTCTCTSDFKDAYGPGCSTVKCGMEYRGRRRLTNGCTPIYFHNGCCSIDWMCPDTSELIATSLQLATGDDTQSPLTHCKLGEIVAPRNDVILTLNEKINCVCATPPDFTCVQYVNATEAAAALASGSLFLS